MRRAGALANEGHLGRAARALGMKNLLDPSDPLVLTALEEMHPASSGPGPQLPESAPFPIVLNDRSFKKFLKKKMANGQAPGPSGWTGEMLLPLSSDPESMRLLAFFLGDFVSGRLPVALKPYFLPATLLALEKEGSTPQAPKPRPIALGELFYRLATGLAIAPLTSRIADILGPVQLGVGQRGGVETAGHFINAMLTDPELGFAGASADIQNAFNGRDRKDILSALYKHDSLSALWRLVDWSYTDATPLWVHTPGTLRPSFILSANGVRQGCALGSLLFALSVADIYSSTLTAHPSVFFH